MTDNEWLKEAEDCIHRGSIPEIEDSLCFRCKDKNHKAFRHGAPWPRCTKESCPGRREERDV